jgi:Fic family protein
MRELHYMDRNAAGSIGLDTPGLPSGATDRYLISSLMEEAIASSQIEGADTTRMVAREMLRTGRKPKDKAEQMILNNYVTIGRIKSLAGEPLSMELLNSLQASMTENTLDDPGSSGRLRRADENIRVVDGSDGTVLHTPPPAGQLESRLEDLCHFANSDEGPFIHPIVKAILLHFWLAYEHPYVDGNGRTARALFYWYALSKGYWLLEYVSVSRAILRAHRQYLRSFLYSETDGCDATYFLMSQLKFVRTAIDDLHLYLDKKQKEYDVALGELKLWPYLNYRQLAVLHHALKHPDAVYTVQSHKNSHRVAYATARWDLLSLSKQGLLEQGKSGKRMVFTVPADLKGKISGNE